MSQFLLGATVGATLMVGRAIGAYSSVAWLLPLHIELVMIGWAVQLAMGVAYWVLPRNRTGSPRGDEQLTITAFVMLNAGILLAASVGVRGLARLAMVGHGVEVLGALLFGFTMWRRLPRSITPRGRSLPLL